MTPTPAKKTAAARKTAASDAEQTTETTDTQTETPDGAAGNDSTVASSAGDKGPGTGTPAPEEVTARPPATLVNETAAAPLEPPADTPTQTEPALGHQSSSTDHTFAAAGGQTVAGEEHKRLVNSKGEPIDPDDMFEEVEARFTFVITKERISEEFAYRNSKQTDRRLLYPAGARVPRDQALALVAAAKAEQAQADDSE